MVVVRLLLVAARPHGRRRHPARILVCMCIHLHPPLSSHHHHHRSSKAPRRSLQKSRDARIRPAARLLHSSAAHRRSRIRFCDWPAVPRSASSKMKGAIPAAAGPCRAQLFNTPYQTSIAQTYKNAVAAIDMGGGGSPRAGADVFARLYRAAGIKAARRERRTLRPM